MGLEIEKRASAAVHLIGGAIYDPPGTFDNQARNLIVSAGNTLEERIDLRHAAALLRQAGQFGISAVEAIDPDLRHERSRLATELAPRARHIFAVGAFDQTDNKRQVRVLANRTAARIAESGLADLSSPVGVTVLAMSSDARKIRQMKQTAEALTGALGRRLPAAIVFPGNEVIQVPDFSPYGRIGDRLYHAIKLGDKGIIMQAEDEAPGEKPSTVFVVNSEENSFKGLEDDDLKNGGFGRLEAIQLNPNNNLWVKPEHIEIDFDDLLSSREPKTGLPFSQPVVAATALLKGLRFKRGENLPPKVSLDHRARNESDVAEKSHSPAP